MNKIKYLSLFSGIGAFEKALKNLGIEYELVNYCEIDKYASKSYSKIHNVPESMNLGDITRVDEKLLPTDIDLLTHGSPCQSFSLAGKQAGGDKGSGTTSSLMWDTVRIVEHCKPKVIVWENVKNLLSKKHRHNFDAYLQEMDEIGYNNYYQVLNAKHYGIPQNRERVYTISIRKDIDNGEFEFPKPFELKLRLKDMLEDEVDEKYYLSDAMIKYISFTGTKNFKNPDCKINLEIARPLTTDQNKRAGTTNYISNDLPDDFDLSNTNQTIRLGGIFDTEKSKHQAGSIWDTNSISPTLDTMQGGYRQPCIIVDDLYKNRQARLYSEISPTLRSERIGLKVIDKLQIRRLTPKECFRLMGFDDEDFEKAKSALTSNTQLYKQAGNSIVVNVVQMIFNNIFNDVLK